MTYLNKFIISTSFAVLMSAQASAMECPNPKAPAIADGAKASEAELIASQKSLKAYQGDLAVYRDCLTKKSEAVNELAEDSAAQKAAIVALYNASVDSETVVANQFNTAVRAYKAKIAQ